MKSEYNNLNKKLNEMRRNGLLEGFFDRLKQAIMKVRDAELDKILNGRNQAVVDLVKAFKLLNTSIHLEINMKSEYNNLNKKLNEMRRNGLLEGFFDRLKQAIMKVRDAELDKILNGRNQAVVDLVKAFKKNPEAFASNYRKSVGR